MRAVFFSLLAINLGLFVWGQLPASKRVNYQQSSRQEANFVGIPSFKLLGEMDRLQPVEIEEPDLQVASNANVQLAAVRETASILPSSSAAQTAGDEGARCEMVGAFRNKNEAANFIERLIAVGAVARQKEMVLPAGPGYWVYLKPERSREGAFQKLKELQSRGIDSYVIPKGELVNGISLGMFSQKDLSEMRLREMKDYGLQPMLEVVERTYREFWVMLDQGEESKMSEITWTRVLDGFDSVERRQNFCLDVAS